MSALEFAAAAAVLRLVSLIASLFPIREELLVASPRGAHLSPQLAALSSAMSRLQPHLRQRRLLEPYGYSLRAKIAYLLRTIRGTWYLQRARITIIDNAWLPVHVVPRRRGTIVVQAWHAEGAYKRFGHAVNGGMHESISLDAVLHRGYSLALVSGEPARTPFAEAFRMPREEVAAVGPLRGAWLADATRVAAARDAVLARWPQLAGKRILLVAPTFRGRGAGRSIGGGISLKELRSKLPADWTIVAKGHAHVADDVALTGADLILDAAIHLEDLFPIADVLLTDYSSSIFLWSLLERPLVIDMSDAAAYREHPGLFLDPAEPASAFIGDLVADATAAAGAITRGHVDGTAWRAFSERHLGPRGELAGAPERAAAAIVQRAGLSLPE